MLASEEWAEANGKEILAEIVAQAQIADEYAYLARTPASAAKKALDRPACSRATSTCGRSTRRSPRSTLNSVRMLGIDEDSVNVNGGAVAIGHPIGASGAGSSAPRPRAASPRRRVGCAAICSGGGQGTPSSRSRPDGICT